MVYIREGGRGCRGRSNKDSNGGDSDDGRGMGVSAYWDIVADVADLGFVPKVMTERILR